MDSLKLRYDEVGDILYLDRRPPYPGQESEPLAYNVVARRNPATGAIENLEILFFTKWLLKEGGEAPVQGLRQFFEESPAAR